MKIKFILLIVFLSQGCISLQTRSSKVKVRKESDLVMALRRQNANLKAKNLEYEEQFRISTGKIEELQILARRTQDKSQKRLGEENQQLRAYKDSVSELLIEKKKLENQILVLKASNQQAKKEVKSAKMSAKEHLKVGNKYFEGKKWSEAAAEYQAFRGKAKNKKNEDYALATYKIGVCFQELGMAKEAKTFYKSVVRKHKKFKAAKYAEYRLAKLKNNQKK